MRLFYRLDVQIILLFIALLSFSISLTSWLHSRGHLINIVGPYGYLKDQFSMVVPVLRDYETNPAGQDLYALVEVLKQNYGKGFVFMVVDADFNILAQTEVDNTYLEMVRREVDPGYFVVTTSSIEKQIDFILFYRKVPGFPFAGPEGMEQNLIIIPEPWLIDPPKFKPVLFHGLRNHFPVYGWLYGAVILFFVVFIRFRLRPLRRIEAASLALTQNRIPAPIPGKPLPDEVGQLVLAFNTALEKLATTEAARRRMVADIAHELRTPLTNLSGRIEAYEDKLIQDPDALIRFTSSQVKGLTRIVEDLNLLTTFDAGQLELHPERFDLKAEMEHLLAAGSIGPDYQWSLVGEPIEVILDSHRFRQAVNNLITNAVQAKPEGLVLQAEMAASAHGLVIHLADNGPGVSREHLPRLFDRLYRVDQGRAAEIGGSGLGLSIVKSLVEAQQGSVDCELVSGGGLRFTIRFPSSVVAGQS